MKVLKVHDDIHQEVKVTAAATCRTTTGVASALLRWALGQLKIGKIKIEKLAPEEVVTK